MGRNASVPRRLAAIVPYVVIFALGVPAVFLSFAGLVEKVVGNPFLLYRLPLRGIGSVLTGLGLSISVLAIRSLWTSGKGLPISALPPEKLVTTGIYRLSRHPLYLGASVMFLGAGLMFSSFWTTVLGWPLFTLFFTCYARSVEEPVLRERYGDRYEAYAQQVRARCLLPVRTACLRCSGALFSRLTAVINRPFILRFGNHIFFLGYGLWLGIGAFFGLTVLQILLSTFSIPVTHMLWIVITCATSMLASTHVVWIVASKIRARTPMHQIIGRVGFVSWGALPAAVVTCVVFAVLTHRSVYIILDCGFLTLMLIHVFGRIGCTFYGCCYGRPTASTAHIAYYHPATKAVREGIVDTHALCPVQLCSSVSGLLTFLLVAALWVLNRVPSGFPVSLIAVLYGLFRFLDEWFRTQKKLLWRSLSPAQLVCIVVVLGGLLHLSVISAFSLEPIWIFEYPPLAIRALVDGLHRVRLIPPAAMGLLTALVFSYHRKEIGRWK